MNDMALIVPSRGRPHNIERLIGALNDTESQVTLFVGIDADDPCYDDYHKVMMNVPENLPMKHHVSLCVSMVRKRFGPTLNAIAWKKYRDYSYLAWMGDDHLPRTKCWDQKYRQALQDNYIVYGNDLVQGENLSTQMGFRSELVDRLGYAVPHGFTHLYIDNYFLELGKATQSIKYLPDVIVEHLHYSAGQSEEDQTYKEANSPENWSSDRERFERYMRYELQNDVRLLS